MANSTKISEYSTTAANNTSIDSIDIDENCAASGINNAIRSVLKHQADAFTQGTPIALDQTNNRVGIGTTSPDRPLQVRSDENDQLNCTIGLAPSTVDTVQGGLGVKAGGIMGLNAVNTLTFNIGGSDGDGASEVARIDSSGDIGIGTSSITNTSGYRNIHIDSPTSGMIMRMYANGTHVGQIQSASDQLQFNAITSIPMIFKTNNTERMRLDNSTASLYVGITDANDVFSSSSGDNGVYIGKQGTASMGVVGDNRLCAVYNRANGTGVIIEFKYNGGIKGSISTNGTSTAYNTTSDHRLKENVADMTGAIDRVKALAPKRFNFIADADTTVDGFLAHEAQTVVPEAVTGTHNEVETWTQQQIDDGDAPDGTSAGDNKLDDGGNTIPVMQGIDQSKLVPLLTGALQEAIAKIETLETEMTALKARVTALEA